MYVHAAFSGKPCDRAEHKIRGDDPVLRCTGAVFPVLYLPDQVLLPERIETFTE